MITYMLTPSKAEGLPPSFLKPQLPVIVSGWDEIASPDPQLFGQMSMAYHLMNCSPRHNININTIWLLYLYAHIPTHCPGSGCLCCLLLNCARFYLGQLYYMHIITKANRPSLRVCWPEIKHLWRQTCGNCGAGRTNKVPAPATAPSDSHLFALF